MNPVYYILIAFVLFGGVLLFLINKDKSKLEQKNSRIKYITYILIVSLFFYTIQFQSKQTFTLFVIVYVIGFYELIRVYLQAKKKHKIFFILAIVLYSIIGFGFVNFATTNSFIISFTYLIVVVFDAFSQLSGQLFGKHPLFSKVSPNKTIEGTVGGVFSTLLFAFLINGQMLFTNKMLITLTLLICVMAIIGDFLASVYKRKYNIKNYSNLLPQHGGVLDRFDSFIFACFVVNFITIFSLYYG